MNVVARSLRVGLTRAVPRWSEASHTHFSSKAPVDTEEWIPPDRPLSGDKGQTHLYPKKGNEKELDYLEEEISIAKLEEALAVIQSKPFTASVVPDMVDWLANRRAKQQGLEMMLPDEATAKRQEATDLPVLRGTLLSWQEIERCMISMGGLDINLIQEGKQRRMGGARGMMFITGNTTSHIRLMADTLVRQLKKRELAKYNVNGAMFGSEGSEDNEDDWRIVDCSNYIVHIQLAETRKRLNLEDLWSGKDPLTRLNIQDEDAVDRYIYENPVPPEIHRARGRRESMDVSETMA